jgi:hypothetical protein
MFRQRQRHFANDMAPSANDVSGYPMNARVTQLQISERTALILSVPILLSVALGWFRAGTMARELSLLYAVLFWLCIWMGYWAAAGGFTLLLERVAPALKRRPWLLLSLGGVCASAASAFYLEPYLGLFDSWLPEERKLRIVQMGALPLSTRIPMAMLNSSFGAVTWVVVNLFALHIGRKASPTRNEPRSTDAQQVASTVGADDENMIEIDADDSTAHRLSSVLGHDVALEDIIALQAQDHYVMVYLPQGKRLVLFRFRDAVAELACVDGAQVHRSWWISAAAARQARRESGSMSFKVREDLIIPVGRTWREHAQRLRTKVIDC